MSNVRLPERPEKPGPTRLNDCGFVLDRATSNLPAMRDQLRHFRAYLTLLFRLDDPR